MNEKQRNINLEYFLKKNFQPNLYKSIRWYESVVVRLGNNNNNNSSSSSSSSLSNKHVVVTEDDIYLTDIHPKTLTHLLHTSQLSHVELVHDIPEFLCLGVREKTTHIHLRYNKQQQHRTSGYSLQPLQHTSSTCIEEEEGDEIDTSKQQQQQQQQQLVSSHTHESAKSAERGSVIVSNNSHTTTTTTTTKTTTKLSERSHSTPLLSRDGNNSSLQQQQQQQHHYHRGGGVGSPEGCHRHYCGHGDTTCHHKQQQQQQLTNLRERTHTPVIAELISRMSEVHMNRCGTPDGLHKNRGTRSLSALDSYYYTSSSTSSSSSNTHRHTPLNLHLPIRSKSVLDKPSTFQQQQQQDTRLRGNVSINDTTDGSEKEIHIYTLSTSTLLFHLLHSLWVASCLVRTQEPIIKSENSEVNSEDNLTRMINDVVMMVTDDSDDGVVGVSMDVQVSSLLNLHHAVLKYPSMRRMIWKDVGRFRHPEILHKVHEQQQQQRRQQQRQQQQLWRTSFKCDRINLKY
ncbi:hypothetical protein Pmani_035221 [Petrolisthes manimaculis]|uniref:Uncharacterized protein n=1 Tax=Petrolisthes manimaculis TaxID=1843537 RepID=A0AAE1TQR0_9EUCA|nr:hypothetical protein Pmani_035221 [Petrolisthes manimaculis]